MSMSPSATYLLGIDVPPTPRRAQEGDGDLVANPQNVHAARTSRRATSHFNPFQTVCTPSNDSPPSYTNAVKQKTAVPRPEVGRERLPKYTCSVCAEGRFILQLESINPLYPVSESEWREVYVTVRGTLLSIFRVKDGGAGKLLRSYTLQHAEVGMATDTQHTVLLPQTRLAHLIPTSARKKAWRKDPDMFKAIRQHLLRLRIETDQILLADASEDRVHDFLNAISAGIDIACPIDERSIPRQSTVPRRRQRRPPVVTNDLNDPALLAEQERILREMYPSFAQSASENPRPELQRTTTEDVPHEPVQNHAREEDELDLAAMREDFTPANTSSPNATTTTRPAVSRQTTASSALSSNSTFISTPSGSENFNADGKWQPPHPRTPAQIQRYTRRCMPVLLAEAVRASDVLICNGKRVKINWRAEVLEEWELKPPSYRAHYFPPTVDEEEELAEGRRSGSVGTELERRESQSSHAQATTVTESDRERHPTDSDLTIAPVETALQNLELAKSVTGSENKNVPSRDLAQAQGKKRETRTAVSEMHGVVFCF